jgi:hypothetical protein
MVGGVGGAAVVMGILGITIAGPALLVAGVVGVLASTFSSKFVLSKVFPNDHVQKFREAFAEAVAGQLDTFRRGGDFTDQVRGQVMNAYGALKENVERETETVIKDTEATLASLNERFTAERVSGEHEKETLRDMAAGCEEMIADAEKLNKQLLPA